MEIIKAGPGDVGALVALVESAYRGRSSRDGWTTEADLLGGQRTDEALLAAELCEPHTTVLMVERDGELAACCAVRVDHELAYFGTFAVRPGIQGGGIGSKLLAAAEDHARNGGAKTLELTVIRQREDLIAYYERRGFVRTGEIRPFPYGDPRYGEPKRDDLAFAVLAKPL